MAPVSTSWKFSNAPIEETRQPIQILRLPHQCIKAFDAQNTPGDSVRWFRSPSRNVVWTDEQAAGELGLVTGNHFTQGFPCIRLPSPITASAAAGKHRDARPRQVTFHLVERTRTHPAYASALCWQVSLAYWRAQLQCISKSRMGVFLSAAARG